jgi:hypothetical protein
VPWSGSGTFTRLYSWVAQKNAGVDILSSQMDADTDDIVTGMENCRTLDGQTVPIRSLPMGGFNHTNVGNATARTNYAAAGQVQDDAFNWGGTSGGTANAQTLSLTPGITSYTAGRPIRFIAGFSNTGAMTLNVNNVGSRSVTAGSAALVGGEIIAGQIYEVDDDGTNFQLLNRTRSPTVTVLTSGSGTYTRPAAATWIAAELVAGGGGSGGNGTSAGNGGTGGNTTFGSLTAHGGSPSTANSPTGGAGGSGSSAGDVNIAGGGGSGGNGTATEAEPGGAGGNSFFGGGGSGGGTVGSTNRAGATNSGGGGGGQGGTSSINSTGGGGSGEYVRKLIAAPSATYSYAVGAGGSAGASGTGGGPGAAGGSGMIVVTEHYG